MSSINIRVGRDEATKKAYELGFKYEGTYGGCCQTVIAAIFESLGLSVDDKVFSAGTGLAGGQGLSGCGACGALIGGGMVISYLYPRTYSNFADPEKVRWNAYILVNELTKKFKNEYGSCICSDIQRKIFGRAFNLMDPKEFEEFIKAGGHTDICPDVVGKAATWAVDIIINAEKYLHSQKPV